MLHVEKLDAENFLSFERMSLEFPKGVVGILGINKDADAADSNGAGKSSLFDAIYFVLFGKSLRGLRIDQLVRNGQTRMSVTLAFSDHTGQNYVLSRGRDGGNSFFSLERDGEALSFESRGFQKALDEIIGISESLFKQVVLFGQGTKRFSELSDTEKKELIEEVLQLDVYAKAANLASKDATELLNEKKKGEAVLEQQISMLEQQETLLAELREKQGQWSGKRELRLLQIEEDLDNLIEREKEHREVLNRSKFLESRQIGAEGYNAKAQELKGAKKSLEDMDNVYASQLQELQEKRQGYIEAARIRYQEHLMLCDLAKGKCPTCGGRVEHAQGYQEKADANFVEYERFERRREKINKQLEQFESAYRDIRKRKEGEIKALEKEINDLGTEINDAKVALERVKVLQMGMDGIERELKAKEEELERVRSERNPHDPTSLEKMIEKLRGQKEGKEKQVAEQHKRWKYASVLSEVMGTKGLRSFLFESVLPELNEGIDRLTEVVTGGSLSARLSIYSETAKGEKREKVSVEVYNPTGGSSYEALSSGEKKRLDLPIAFALQEIVHRRGLGMNVTLLDEAFENVDESGASGLLALFSEVMKRNKAMESLLVVTHDAELGGRMGQQLRIVKDGGVSSFLM